VVTLFPPFSRSPFDTDLGAVLLLNWDKSVLSFPVWVEIAYVTNSFAIPAPLNFEFARALSFSAGQRLAA